MTTLQHKTAWRAREQPYSRPRISQRDIELAERRVAEAAEAEERAAKWICVFLVAVTVCVVGAVWVI